jgi:hypothetical protein
MAEELQHFKRELGIAPGAYRKTRGAAAHPARLIAIDIPAEPTPPDQPARNRSGSPATA